MLDRIPEGVHCFVDANILCYSLIRTSPLTADCLGFMKRIRRGKITASTSSAIVAEAIHKVMLAEAVARYGLDHKGLAHRLQRQADLIAALNEHRKVVQLIRALNFHVEAITLEILEKAGTVSSQYRLLTNDALTVATMERLGLSQLATKDDNFDSVAGITVWKSR